jgi:hypothetical protein
VEKFSVHDGLQAAPSAAVGFILGSPAFTVNRKQIYFPKEKIKKPSAGVAPITMHFLQDFVAILLVPLLFGNFAFTPFAAPIAAPELADEACVDEKKECPRALFLKIRSVFGLWFAHIALAGTFRAGRDAPGFLFIRGPVPATQHR